MIIEIEDQSELEKVQQYLQELRLDKELEREKDTQCLSLMDINLCTKLDHWDAKYIWVDREKLRRKWRQRIGI